MDVKNHVNITDVPFDVGEVSQMVGDDSCGAISIFVGTTRNNFMGMRVARLEYEAYEEMAYKELNKICDMLRRRWNDVCKIAIIHRIGVVPVGEASVIIAISSPHRQTSLEAVETAIDALKRRVPIWKKEFYCNEMNQPEWIGNKECHWQPEEECEK